MSAEFRDPNRPQPPRTDELPPSVSYPVLALILVVALALIAALSA